MSRETRRLHEKYGYNSSAIVRDGLGQSLSTREQQWWDLEDDEAFQDEILRKYGLVDIARFLHEVREES